jgi:hypothetical protein
MDLHVAHVQSMNEETLDSGDGTRGDAAAWMSLEAAEILHVHTEHSMLQCMYGLCNSATSRGKLLHGSASRTLQNWIEMAPA